MARRKRSGFAAFLEEFSPVSLFFHPATLFLVFNLLLAVAAVQLWSRYQHRIVDFQSVALTAEKIHINAPPAWAKTNLKRAILGSTETPKSLLDPALVPDAVATFQSVGWIEEIRQMEKTREGLSVDLVYRHPIALVELHSKTVPGWNKSPRLIPVDRRGVIMPESLAMQTAQPKIFLYHSDASQRRAPQHLKHIHRWTPWPDARVQDAAAIGEKLIGNWQSFGLSRIISWRLFSDADNATIPFELWTDEGENAATIVWGNAPGSELEGEAAWQQKLAALESYVQQHGALNKLPERIIDLRSGQAIVVGRASGLGYKRSFEVR